MRLFQFRTYSYVACVAVVLLSLLAAVPVSAQRLVFQKADTLFVAGEDGKDARILLNFGTTDTLWAASPDGRRIAWMTRPAPSDKAATVTGLAARPAVIRISDFSGRHQKRLFATDSLRDRQGRKIVKLAVYPIGGPEATEEGQLDEWEPVSLSWSADSRTLYLSCFSTATLGPKATFAVDGAAGLALIDADGRWKAIAPITHVAAQGGLLVGSGFARYKPDGGDELKYSPLVAVNLFEGERVPLYAPAAGLKELPEYAFAIAPSLAPENRAIVFVAEKKGIWLTDKFGKSYRKIADGAVRCPRFSADSHRVLFLVPRPLTGNQVIYDLYSVAIPATVDAPTDPPILVLQGVDWFDVIPD